MPTTKCHNFHKIQATCGAIIQAVVLHWELPTLDNGGAMYKALWYYSVSAAV